MGFHMRVSGWECLNFALLAMGWECLNFALLAMGWECLEFASDGFRFERLWMDDAPSG